MFRGGPKRISYSFEPGAFIFYTGTWFTQDWSLVQLSPPPSPSSPSPVVSEVHSVRLSRNSCMISVLSL